MAIDEVKRRNIQQQLEDQRLNALGDTVKEKSKSELELKGKWKGKEVKLIPKKEKEIDNKSDMFYRIMGKNTIQKDL